jgi:ACS family hexuronate transporter-like MFS transporter
MLFLAVILSYIDRLVIGVLKPTLTDLYHWTEGGYANTALVFQASYGIGFLVFGRLIDRIGPRAGYLLAMTIWTVAHIGHAFMTTTREFALMRIPLGIGEAGTYPAALAAASQWFNRRERALAIGIFNAGANFGAIITPLLVPALALGFGWQSAFIVTGLFNVVWIAAWWFLYRKPREHKRVTAEEVAWIESEPAVDTGRSSFRPLSHRPGVVDLPLLAPRLLLKAVRHQSRRLRAAFGRDLSDVGRRRDRGRLDELALARKGVGDRPGA